MKRKMIGFLTMALAVSAVGTLGSCKDYDDDNRVELQGEYAKLDKDLQDWILKVKACQDECKTFRESLVGADGNGGRLHAFDEAMADLDGRVDALETLLEKNSEGKTRLDLLEELLEDYTDVKSNIKTVYAIIGTMTPQEFKAKMDAITTLGNEIDNLTGEGGELESIRGKLAALENLNPGIDEDRAKFLADSIANVKVDAAVSKLLGEGDQTLTLNGVNNALVQAEDSLQNQIDTLRNRMDDFDEELAALKKNFAQLVTSVLVQGTYNPIFGSLTAPFNVQSNVLAAYYGTAETKVDFPFANAGMLVNSDNALSEKDIEMIGTAKGAIDLSKGTTLTDNNAGTIYLTVNPTAVDFDGVKFRLENSLGDESPVKLGTLRPSSKRLTFGWTRGAAANGFYEAQATVAEEDIQNAKLVVDMTKSDVQEIFKDITSPRDGIDIMNIANKVYSVVNDVCDANAVKAYWGEGTTANSTLSQYSIAATAVKPLSFAFMKDFHKDTFWGVDRVQNFINKTIDGINISIDNIDNIEVPTINHISFDNVKTQVGPDGKTHYYLTVSIKDEVAIDGIKGTCNLGDFINGVADVEIVDEFGNISKGKLDLSEIFGDKQIEVEIKDQKQEIEITGEVDITNLIEPIEGFNGTLDELNEFMGQVNDMLDEVNKINTKIEDAKDNIASEINKYIDALNKRLCNVVNSIHDRLQPLAIAHNGKEFYTLSGVKNMPSKVSGNTLNIVPTTYTAELVVPVFKKHVAVTNVFKGSASAQGGDAACLNALKAANNKGGMNTVVAGTTRNVEFVGEKGFVYEIAYSALDYSGKAVTKKYYVTVE